MAQDADGMKEHGGPEDLALLRSPYSTLFGHRMLLFDLGGTIATVCMLGTAILLTARHTVQLYREEPLP